MPTRGKDWKRKLKNAKNDMREKHELENKHYDFLIMDAEENGDRQLADKLRAERDQAVEDRDFSITGRKRKPVIKDKALFDENKKANFKKRKGIYEWTEGGRQLAREQRVSKKKNMDSPVSAQGSLATVCRKLDRWEMGYGTEISLKKGSVVMPISEPYEWNNKKCVTVMAGQNIFKGVPVAVLRPVEDE